jgi:hypothetical protein
LRTRTGPNISPQPPTPTHSAHFHSNLRSNLLFILRIKNCIL